MRIWFPRHTPTGSGEALLAVRIVFLYRVQNLQIHAVRANFRIMFSVRSTAMGRARGTSSAHLQLIAPFSPDSETGG